MAFPFSPKPPPFTATTLIARIRTTFREFPDERRGGNHQRYTVDDAALSAWLNMDSRLLRTTPRDGVVTGYTE